MWYQIKAGLGIKRMQLLLYWFFVNLSDILSHENGHKSGYFTTQLYLFPLFPFDPCPLRVSSHIPRQYQGHRKLTSFNTTKHEITIRSLIIFITGAFELKNI